MKKVKHDHKGTKALKLTIFFSLMLAPMLAVLFKCCYVTFNKNAYQSYNNEILDNEIAIGNSGTLYENNRYRLIYNSGTPANNAKIIYSDININWVNYGANANNEYVGFLINDANYIYLYTDTTSAPATTLQNVWGNTLTNFIFTKANGNTNITNNTNIKVYLLSYKQNTLDNAFYYAIDEMKDNQLFNWTTNTALYTPTSAMTTGMGITTDALPILITYWLYLTAIYIVIDIVVELFTYLTHMITGRISA